MRFSLAIVALVATLSGQALAGGPCFDAGDCLIQGGGKCVRNGFKILGTCSKSGSGGPTATNAARSPATTTAPQGGICFDAGDCLLQGGGKCVRNGFKIVGHCVKNSS